MPKARKDLQATADGLRNHLYCDVLSPYHSIRSCCVACLHSECRRCQLPRLAPNCRKQLAKTTASFCQSALWLGKVAGVGLVREKERVVSCYEP